MSPAPFYTLTAGDLTVTAVSETRYAAILPRDNLHHLATTAAVFIYQPITARLRQPGAARVRSPCHLLPFIR
ncbi:hypothetical protein CQA70_29195 [Klebsiella pneumoniae]|nr:hypothetical protein CQA70_29195 [Klebsiella pneumoniae]